ncbi:MAG: hypothetical protein M3021_11855 [Actinomycetota bacterium]|nr:hypothetical protein [Actinomycetota bacterium]
MRAIVIPRDRLLGESSWPAWSIAYGGLLALELLYLLLVGLPVHFGDINRMAYASHMGGGGYPLNWWRGDVTLEPGLLYTAAQLVWMLLPCLGGPLLGAMASAVALTWPYSSTRARLVRVLLLASSLAIFALAWTTWDAAQYWFSG